MKENILIDKSISFASRIIKLHDYLIKSKKGLKIAKQIVRSGTSIGANINEATKRFVNTFLDKFADVISEEELQKLKI